MMATTAKNLALVQVSDAALTTVYTTPTGSNTRISKLGFTNTGSTAVTISIYHYDGATNFLIKALTLPAGAGIERPYYDLQRAIFNSGHAIKVQASSAITYNVAVHGSEIEVASA